MLNVVKLIVCVESRAARAVAAIQGQAAAYETALATLSAAVERARADVQAARDAAEARISAGSAAAALSLEALTSAMADDVKAVDSLAQDQASGLEEFACQCGDDAPPVREDKPAKVVKPRRERLRNPIKTYASEAGVIAAETKYVRVAVEDDILSVWGPNGACLYAVDHPANGDMLRLTGALSDAGVAVFRSQKELDAAITNRTLEQQSS